MIVATDILVIAIFVVIPVIIADLAPKIFKLIVDNVVKAIGVANVVDAIMEAEDNRVGLGSIQHKALIRFRLRWLVEVTISPTT